MSGLRSFVIVIFVGMAWASDAFGHAIGVEVKLLGNTIQVDAYYDDGTPARSAPVTIRETEDSPALLKGETDAAGRWVVAAPKPGKYLVMVNALDGHVARTSIKIAEPATTLEVAQGQFEESISDSPSREEFTTFPWWKLLAGLAFCAIVSGVAWFRTHQKRTAIA